MELHIVDGTNMIHRAFHAMPPLTTSKGKPVGAVQGLMNMLLSMHRLSPDATHRVCVFDPANGSELRKLLFPEYKGNRFETEDALNDQRKPCYKGAKALGWATIEVRGVEADDVIAALTEQFRSKFKKAKVVIHTGDKDMMQLIEPVKWVTVNNPIKKVIFDWDAAKEIWGVDPNMIPQVQALLGDKIDNIPGCPSVGMVTAQKLLLEHGSLKALIKYAKTQYGEKKCPAVLKKIVDNEDQIKMSLKLATLRTDVLPKVKWKEFAARGIDRENGIAFCKKWELKTLQTRIMTL